MSGPDVVRFGKTTRWFHACFASSFLTLALTGIALMFRETLALSQAGADLMLQIHLGSAISLIAAPSLVLLSGDTAGCLSDLGEVVRFDAADWAWIKSGPLGQLGARSVGNQGKLNAGQKASALIVALTTGALCASGLQLWLEPGANLALLIHVAAMLVWLPVFAVHFFMAVLNPHTRPALRSMWTGRVSRAWAEHHHERWLREIDES